MMRPKSIVKQDSMISEAVKAELQIARKHAESVLFDAVNCSADYADKVVAEYNAKWIAAGGSCGSMLGNRADIPEWQLKR